MPCTSQLLIVEDDIEFREIVERRFRRLGIEVIGCDKLDDAIEAVTQARFQAALVDGRLQGRSGIELMERLLQTDAELPVIVLSGSSDEASISRAKAAGAREYLCKPCSLLEIEAAVWRFIRSSQIAQPC